MLSFSHRGQQGNLPPVPNILREISHIRTNKMSTHEGSRCENVTLIGRAVFCFLRCRSWVSRTWGRHNHRDYRGAAAGESAAPSQRYCEQQKSSRAAQGAEEEARQAALNGLLLGLFPSAHRQAWAWICKYSKLVWFRVIFKATICGIFYFYYILVNF